MPTLTLTTLIDKFQNLINSSRVRILPTPLLVIYERQKITLKMFAVDAIAILGTEFASLPVLQMGGHSSLSNG